MPADPDLDALDALLKAATPGEWKQGTKHPGAIIAGREWVGDFYRECDAALIAAAVNALPALLRRARIGDAAREVADAAVAADDAALAHAEGGRRMFGTNGTAERALETLQAFMAARARYRALLETPAKENEHVG